jgi:hypothetical protein
VKDFKGLPARDVLRIGLDRERESRFSWRRTGGMRRGTCSRLAETNRQYKHTRTWNIGLDQPFTVEVSDQLAEGLNWIEGDLLYKGSLYGIRRGYVNGSDLFLRCQS